MPPVRIETIREYFKYNKAENVSICFANSDDNCDSDFGIEKLEEALHCGKSIQVCRWVTSLNYFLQ